MPALPHPNKTPCDPVTLQRFLAGECTATEEQSIEQHLTDCQDCRRAMEQQAAAPEFWRAAARQLDTRRDLNGETHHPPLAPAGIALAARPDLEDYLRTWLTPSDASDSIGEIESYQVQAVVGIGGMGMVLQARDPRLRRNVAIKTLRPELAANVQARQRFSREAQLAASLHHPNVVSIFHVGCWRGVDYIVMPLVEQGSLRDYCVSQTLSLDQIIQLGQQVAAGLAAAHGQGMIHRDIKPSNILLLGGLAEVVVADFGLARVVGSDTVTLSGELHGTPQFMSPEQACGRALDSRSDLFSLGSLLYWMATGRSPFEAENHFATLSKIERVEYQAASLTNVQLPAWFDRLIESLLVKDPNDRSLNAARLTRLLAQLAEHRRQPASVPLPLELASRPGSLKPVIPWIAGALACILVVLPLFYFLDNSPDPASSKGSPTPQHPAATTDTTGPDGSSTALQRSGPLDELDRVNLVADLKAGQRVRYWLQRLSALPVSEIPAESLPLIAEIAKQGTAEQRELADSVLQKNPFEALDNENPFIPVD